MSLRVLAFAGLAFASLHNAAQAQGSSERITVSIDQARVLKVDAVAETIIIGNPAIVDVAIHDAQTLILTGRSYGVTNLVVLAAAGDAILDENVVVNSVETASVRVYRQAQRSTYSCSPSCEPTVTIGDTDASFGGAASQFGTRESLARGAGE